MLAGFGRRPRRLGDANERAYKTVTARIRDSLARITARRPSLGVHLNATRPVPLTRPLRPGTADRAT
jgi:hypothetical protein